MLLRRVRTAEGMPSVVRSLAADLDKNDPDYVSDRTLLRAIAASPLESLFETSPQRLIRLRVELSTRRSSRWRPTRKEHLRIHYWCVICGEEKPSLLTVHHFEPFHEHPELELDPDNLRTMCEGVVNDHFLFGHLRNWKHSNANLDQDAEIWALRLMKNKAFILRS
jgi:hypothetical protein